MLQLTGAYECHRALCSCSLELYMNYVSMILKTCNVEHFLKVSPRQVVLMEHHHLLLLLVTEKYLLESSYQRGVHKDFDVSTILYCIIVVDFLYTSRPRAPVALVTSLSEGEVPHSPGEAQWYAMYTSRIDQAGLAEWNDRSKRKLDLTRVTLKSSLDPTSSDSSDLSENPQKVRNNIARIC